MLTERAPQAWAEDYKLKFSFSLIGAFAKACRREQDWSEKKDERRV